MQEFLSSNREALIDKGVLYPYSGHHTERDVAHNAFAAASGQGRQHELPIGTQRTARVVDRAPNRH